MCGKDVKRRAMPPITETGRGSKDLTIDYVIVEQPL